MSSARSSKSLVFALLGAVAGAAAVLLAGLPLDPPPSLHDQPFRLVRAPDDPLVVAPERPLQLGYEFGDFDLFADVELADETDLDVLVREVEPRLRDGDMPLFHGRFIVLRASTRAAQPGAAQSGAVQSGATLPGAALSRDAALFGDVGGGQPLAAGHRATLVVQARGRRVRANLAGVWLPVPIADDAHGMIAFAVRGGRALLHSLEIQPVSRARELRPWTWGALAGLLLGALVSLARRSSRAVWGALALPAFGWLGGRLLLSHVVRGAEPEVFAVVMTGLSGFAVWPSIAFASVARVRLAALALAGAVVLALACLEAAARLERPRLRPLEDPRLDLCFGWGSGTAPADALQRRLRARSAVHSVVATGERVLFTGGGPLWEGGDLEQHLAPLAAAVASRTLGRRVEAVVVPTVYGHALQQRLLLERFYLPHLAPRLVVFGVPPWEGEISERHPPRAVLEGRVELPSGFGSVLLATWRAAMQRVRWPTADAASLRKTLDELAALARRDGFLVIVHDAPELPSELRAAVDAAVQAHGFLHRRATWAIGAAVDPQPLGEQIARALGAR